MASCDSEVPQASVAAPGLGPRVGRRSRVYADCLPKHEALHAPAPLWYTCAMDDLLPNPFQPSSGGEPPHRAGHDFPARYLTLALAEIRGGGCGDVFLLYGPRLFGKTALLREFKRKASCDKIEVAAFEAHRSKPESQDPLGPLTVCGDDQQQQRLGSEIMRAWESDLQSGATVEKTTEALREMLEKGPLLLALDGAHNIQFNVLETLSGAARQCVDENRPLLVLLTSSHSLRIRPPTSRFAPREYRVAHLGDKLIREALAIPARRAGRNMKRGALRMIADKCEGFPYFAQLVGKKVWDIEPRRRVRHDRITKEDAAAGIKEARREMDAFCERSLKELEEAGLLKAAIVVCHLFDDATNLSEGLIYERLADVCQEAKMTYDDIKAGLLDFGVITPEISGMVPGIPLFCKFIADRHPV